MFYHQREIRETYGYNYESLIGSLGYEILLDVADDEGIEAVEELRDELDSSIKWFDTMDELRGFLDSDDVGLRWYGHIRIFASFVKQVNELSV